MAVIHDATLNPPKLELLQSWLESQPWAATGDAGIEARYRFDDPAGEVGIETLLARLGDGRLVQAPLTYRDGPLDGAEAFLISTMEHSVLGTRWVYDAVGDPVYQAVLASVILGGGGSADLVDADGAPLQQDNYASVVGSGTGRGSLADSVGTQTPAAESPVVTTGSSTVIPLADTELVVLRALGEPIEADEILSGTWPGSAYATTLAGIRRR